MRACYRAAEQIQTARSPRDADILTGYAIGVIMEKYAAHKLTSYTAEAIADMAEAVGAGKRNALIAERQGREPEPDAPEVYQFADYADADGETDE